MVQVPPSMPLMMHGLGQDKVPAVWPPLAETEISTLLAFFPQAGQLGEVLWHSPRPLSSAALVQTDCGTLFVKRLPATVRTVAQLQDEHRFMQYLRTHQTITTEVLLTATGASAWGSAEWTYEVHHMGPGTDLYQDYPSWTPYASDGDAWQAGAALARLHIAAAGYKSLARPAMVLSGGGTLLSVLIEADAAGIVASDVQLDTRLSAWLPQRTEAWLAKQGDDWQNHVRTVVWPLVRAAQKAGLSADLPSLWTHNDWHGSNLLWRETGIKGRDIACVLDFGLCDLGWPMLDLAIAIERSGIDWLGPEFLTAEAPWHAAQIAALIQGYHRQRPLSQPDLLLLAALLPVAHIEFALSEIEFYGCLMQDSASAMIAYDTYLLGHARWFGSAAGQRLLALICHCDLSSTPD